MRFFTFFMFFSVQQKSQKSRARAGTIHTAHGDLQTPVLMTVGTKATVKTLSTEQLEEIGVPVVLCNTYHLHLNPGADLVQQAGGLHGFMNWKKPMFTDSGGFQIFSLGHGGAVAEVKGKICTESKKSLIKISEEGALFRSYRDGSKHMISPEKSMEIQWKLGADMIAAFDELTPMHFNKQKTRSSLDRTHRWLLRSKAELERLESKQALYGIIQGGVHLDLRDLSTDFVQKADTPGICIGGSLGETQEEMFQIGSHIMQRMEVEKPVHLLGIGDLDSLVYFVGQGIDTFDCVAPTRNARHGHLFSHETANRKLNLKLSCYKNDFSPLDAKSSCPIAQKYTKAYVHYLLKAEEMLGYQICTYVNVWFVTRFMEKIRTAIVENRFEEFQEKYFAGEEI